jgi:hypothetical protein
MAKKTKTTLSLYPQTGNSLYREQARSIVRHRQMTGDRHFGACESSAEKHCSMWTLERFENALFAVMAYMSVYWGDHERLARGRYELEDLFHRVCAGESDAYSGEVPGIHVSTRFVMNPNRHMFVLEFRSEEWDLTSTEDLFDAVRGRIVGVAKRVRERRREMMGDPKYLVLENGMTTVAKEPPAPCEGTLRYNEEQNEFLCYSRGEWRPIGGVASSKLIEWRPGCFAREGEMIEVTPNYWLSFYDGKWKFETLTSAEVDAGGFFSSHEVEELPLRDNGQKNRFAFKGSGRK